MVEDEDYLPPPSSSSSDSSFVSNIIEEDLNYRERVFQSLNDIKDELSGI